MIVLTVLMFVAILCLAPLKFSVSFNLQLDTKKCLFELRMFGICVMKETVELLGRYMVCSGTVEETVDLSASSGTNFTKSIVLDELQLLFLTGCQGSVWNLLLAEMCAQACAVFASVGKCKVCVQTQLAVKSAVSGKVKFSISLAEIISTLAQNAAKHSNRLLGR